MNRNLYLKNASSARLKAMPIRQPDRPVPQRQNQEADRFRETATASSAQQFRLAITVKEQAREAPAAGPETLRNGGR